MCFVFSSDKQWKGVPEAQEQSGLSEFVLLTLKLMDVNPSWHQHKTVPLLYFPELLPSTKIIEFSGLKLLSRKVGYLRVKKKKLIFLYSQNDWIPLWFVYYTMMLFTKWVLVEKKMTVNTTKVIFNRSQSVYKKPTAVLVPAAGLGPLLSVEGITDWTDESTNHCGKCESVGSGGSPLISSSSLWVSWPAGGTGCRSRCPRWPLRRERHRWEEAWSSLCQLLDHPEWGKQTKDGSETSL